MLKTILDHPANKLSQSSIDVLKAMITNMELESYEENNNHYEALKDCSRNILKSIDNGKVPKAEIKGLRILMTNQ